MPAFRSGVHEEVLVPDVVDSAPEIRRNCQKRPAIFVKYYFGVRALLLLPLFPGAFALEDQCDSRHGEASQRCNDCNPYACCHTSQITPSGAEPNRDEDYS